MTIWAVGWDFSFMSGTIPLYKGFRLLTSSALLEGSITLLCTIINPGTYKCRDSTTLTESVKGRSAVNKMHHMMNSSQLSSRDAQTLILILYWSFDSMLVFWRAAADSTNSLCHLEAHRKMEILRLLTSSALLEGSITLLSTSNVSFCLFRSSPTVCAPGTSKCRDSATLTKKSQHWDLRRLSTKWSCTRIKTYLFLREELDDELQDSPLCFCIYFPLAHTPRDAREWGHVG
ncbi:acetyl-coenzyme A carboxylase carboxyltransferase subunit beta [Striga asiatica]|uniref:Acetyl-coenzyme A carboxylase carboxyltransferase subunit beta n=1 Tax=Striga asiatica TaxID=4170 RepID=A0A5A7PUS0_STRAF|nr:acetyl-coenzyme A carboxylase carboxyltransferase subunit beta [Striga asiatica]